MSANTASTSIRSRIENLIAMAQLLERIDAIPWRWGRRSIRA